MFSRALLDGPRGERLGYFLGALAGGAKVSGACIELRIRGSGEPIRSLFRAGALGDGPLEVKELGDRWLFPMEWARSFAVFLGAAPGEFQDYEFPDLKGRAMHAFSRGLFEQLGKIASEQRPELEVSIRRPGAGLEQGWLTWLGIVPTSTDKEKIYFRSSAALDFLGRIYAGGGPSRPKWRNRYLAWSTRVLGLSPGAPSSGTILVQRTRADAVFPGKERISDSGYDLTLVYEKERKGRVIFYGTGLIVEPPQGWYFDVVARSSIVKKGYMLANNVGVIDRAYRGEILVPLVRIDPDAPDLELPARVAQLIPRPIVHFELLESSELTSTTRGAGGFGSTG